MRSDDHRDRLGNRPHERDQFPRDRRDRDIRMLAARGQSTKALTQPDLCFPADVLNRFGQPINAALNVLGDLGGMSIRPRPFDQGTTGNRASSTASRRSVFTLSPGFFGMSDGATT